MTELKKPTSEEIVASVSDNKLFRLFMKKRFPSETFVSYIKEWDERFRSGNPVSYMDSESKKAYQEAIKELYG